MDLWGVVRYVQRMCGNSSTHLPSASSSLFLSPLTMTLLTASACPFLCGCARVEYLFIMPRSQQYLLTALLSNWRPLSKMRVRGIPNQVTIFFQKNLLASTSLIFANGSASIHLVKYFVPTNKYFLFPAILGKGHTMSKPHWAKGQGLDRGLRTPPNWWMFSANL